MFTAELYKEFDKYKEDMSEIEDNYVEHKKRQLRSLTRPTEPDQLIIHNGVYYLQLLLCRSINLIEGVFLAVNVKNPLIAILATRAHFETTGALALFADKVTRFHKGTMDIRSIEKILQKLVLGTRFCELHDRFNAPKSENVMNYIDAIDKMLCGLGVENKEANFRKNYEFLSEFCHPNTYGVALTHQLVAGSAIFNTSPTLSEKEIALVKHICYSASLFILLYDDVLEKLLFKDGREILSLGEIAKFNEENLL